MKRAVLMTEAKGSSVTSCGTSPTSDRLRRKSVTTSWPPTVIRPAVGWVMPQIAEISVVFPAPFGPSSARISPSSIARSIPFSASKPEAKVLRSPSTRTMAGISVSSHSWFGHRHSSAARQGEAAGGHRRRGRSEIAACPRSSKPVPSSAFARPRARSEQGALWRYSDEIVLDRRTRGIAPGSVVVLEDAERRPLGTAAFNAASKITVRMLDPDPAAEIGRDWFAARLARALALRETLFDAPFYRLVHAEADGLPGVVIDRFGAAAAVQPNAAWAEVLLPALVEALQAVTGVATVVKNAGGRSRSLEGLDAEGAVLAGQLDGPVEVRMNGAVYLADLTEGQKTGIFYDQRPNHAFAARLAPGRSMLDVFTHVGGFALAALAAGATSALGIDGSAPALDLATRGAVASGVAERFEARRADAFDAMAALAAEGRRFGLVVCDPPAFAPNRAALEAGLRAYERVARLAATLVEPDGFLVLCSCSHAADLARFREASLHGVARAGRAAQIVHTGGAGPDHPVHPALAETAYLKALFLRLGA